MKRIVVFGLVLNTALAARSWYPRSPFRGEQRHTWSTYSRIQGAGAITMPRPSSLSWS